MLLELKTTLSYSVHIINYGRTLFMYAIVAGVFVVLTWILFWSRTSWKSEERKSTSTTTSGERKGAI
jgi:hypothetical protein